MNVMSYLMKSNNSRNYQMELNFIDLPEILLIKYCVICKDYTSVKLAGQPDGRTIQSSLLEALLKIDHLSQIFLSYVKKKPVDISYFIMKKFVVRLSGFPANFSHIGLLRLCKKRGVRKAEV